MATPVTKSARDLRSAQGRGIENRLPGLDFQTLLDSRGVVREDKGPKGLLTTKEGLNDYLIALMKDRDQKPQVWLQAAKQIAEINGLTTGSDSDLRTKTDEELFELLEQFAPLMREFLRPPPNPLSDTKVQRVLKCAKHHPEGYATITQIAQLCFRNNKLQAEKFADQLQRVGLGKRFILRTRKRGRPAHVFKFDFEVVEKLRALDNPSLPEGPIEIPEIQEMPESHEKEDQAIPEIYEVE